MHVEVRGWFFGRNDGEHIEVGGADVNLEDVMLVLRFFANLNYVNVRDNYM